MDAAGKAIRDVIEACFPAFCVRSISFPVGAGWSTYLAEGWGSAEWEVNEDYVFRFPKRPEIAPGLLKEIRLLPVLAPNLPLRVPQFECVWPGGPPYAGVFVGYHKIPGQQLSPEHIHSAAPELAQQLGAFLTSLHRFPLAQAAALGVPGGRPQEWRE